MDRDQFLLAVLLCTTITPFHEFTCFVYDGTDGRIGLRRLGNAARTTHVCNYASLLGMEPVERHAAKSANLFHTGFCFSKSNFSLLFLLCTYRNDNDIVDGSWLDYV